MPAFICTACGTQYPPSEALPGACPICIDERQFVPASGQSWQGDTKPIAPGLTLVRLGGHFEGGTVLHWADWSEGRGVLLSGDILQVVPSGHVSFMWSYPNLIPLSAAKVQRMAEILEPFAFDAVYGPFSGRGQIDANGKQVVAASVARYIARMRETNLGSQTTSV